jgi:hypothetical protein
MITPRPCGDSVAVCSALSAERAPPLDGKHGGGGERLLGGEREWAAGGLTACDFG